MEHVMQTYFNDIVKSTAELLKFDSSLRPAEEGYPFGKEAADCLAFFLAFYAGRRISVSLYHPKKMQKKETPLGISFFCKVKFFAILSKQDKEKE